MDKLDIFELDTETKIVITVSELQRLYYMGINDSQDGIECENVVVRGDIV